MEFQDKETAFADLVYACRQMRARGLVNATHGNVSVRVGGVMYITPTGSDLETVAAEDLVAMDIASAKVIGPGKPSKEWEMHLLTYRLRPDAGGVVHGHTPKSVALGCRYSGAHPSIVPAYSLAFALFTKELPLLEYRRAGSHELAEGAANLLRDHAAVLLAHHGLITVAPTVRKAYYRLEEVEENCGIALAIGLTGNASLDRDNL